MSSLDEWHPHGPKQEQVIFSDKRIVLLACGIQFGKTIAGANRMKVEMHRHSDPSDNFLIMAPTYKILQQSTLPPFLSIMRENGDYSKVDAVFKMYSGGTCYFRTATDPVSIVGITNIRHIWLDEAGLFSLYAWENVLARAAFKKASIVLTTSPYTLNWIYKDFIRPKLKDSSARPDCELIQARSDENPYFPKEEFEHRRATMDPRRFNMMFGGLWGKVEGLVYDCFEEDENIISPISLPTGSRFYAGLDWGYTHPFALVIIAVTPGQTMHYVVSEVYKSGLSLSQILEICKQKISIFGIEKFYCDPSQPGAIEELNRNGVPAIGANNDVTLGIQRVYELVKTRRLKFFQGSCPFLIDEIETYHYAPSEDESPDKDRKERGPVKQQDHAMDALRYGIMGTYRGIDKKAPIIPEEIKKYNVSDPNRFRKRSVYGNQTESWG